MYDGIVRTYNKSTFFLFTIRVLVSQAQIEMKEEKKKGRKGNTFKEIAKQCIVEQCRNVRS